LGETRGLYHEAGLGGEPTMFQFSLSQPWVLGTIKVVWLLAVFIAIVTQTPQLTWSGAGYVPGKRLQTKLRPISCEQSGMSDAIKSLHLYLLQIKGHYKANDFKRQNLLVNKFV